ncbi:hypothetical protein Tco_0206955 [Tanacetum coccineum]
MDHDSVHMVAASKVPMLKPENGNAHPIAKLVEGVETVIDPSTAEENAQRRLLRRGLEGMLLLKRLRNLLKQQYEIFTASSSEVLVITFDRIQKLISLLEIHSESISQEDVNQKFLKSLPPEWNTHTIIWWNKPEIDTLSLDDLYNNLKIYESEVKGTSNSSTNTQNVAFVSSNNTSSTNGEVNTAYGVTTASTQVTVVNSTTIDNLSDVIISAFFVSQPNSPHLDNEDLQQINPDDLEEMDMRWAPRNQENRCRENTRTVPMETTTSNALILCDGLGDYDWKEFVNKPIVSESTVKKLVVETSEAKASADKPKVVRKNNGAPIIED